MAQDDGQQLGFEDRTIGGRLRAAREGRGLSLQDIANQTRIPVRHLQHVEQEEWDDLPAVTYCVGFVRAYANAVGLDGQEFGREVREQLSGVRPRAAAAEYYEPTDPARVPPRSLAIVALLVGIALLIGYAIWRSTLSDVDQPPAPALTAAPQQQPAAQAPPASPQAVAGQPVTIVATGEVWLRITDGTSGTSLFQGVLASGQSFAIPATAQRPVLRTGRPQMLRATVGGRDLGPLDTVERTVSDLSLRAEDLATRQPPQAR